MTKRKLAAWYRMRNDKELQAAMEALESVDICYDLDIGVGRGGLLGSNWHCVYLYRRERPGERGRWLGFHVDNASHGTRHGMGECRGGLAVLMDMVFPNRD